MKNQESPVQAKAITADKIQGGKIEVGFIIPAIDADSFRLILGENKAAVTQLEKATQNISGNIKTKENKFKIFCEECQNEDILTTTEYNLLATENNKFEINLNVHDVKLEIKCKNCGNKFSGGG